MKKRGGVAQQFMKVVVKRRQSRRRKIIERLIEVPRGHSCRRH
jgi:hypothetical protein